MSADQYAPPFPPNVAAAVAQVYAGVTIESAAKANHCTETEIAHALILPETKLIEATAEWDSVDLLSAEFRDTPDILAGAIPVGLTLISAARPRSARLDSWRRYRSLQCAAVSSSAVP